MKQKSEKTFGRPSLRHLSMLLSLGLTGLAVPGIVPVAVAQTASSDQAIAANVVKTLGTYPDLAGEHIAATSQNGIVTLTGTASSETAKDQAQVVAATVDGVRSVVNNVTVAGGSSAADTPQQATTGDSGQQQPYTPQQQPQPGTEGNWGQAGPPPDADNGRIPSQPQNSEPQADGSGSQQAGGAQYPMQDPGQEQSGASQYPGQYPAQNQGARPAYVPPSSYAPPANYQQGYAQPQLSPTPVTIQPGTLFSIRTSEPLDSHRLQGGETFQAVLAQDVFSGPYLAIPRGAVLQGQVVGVKRAGAVRGNAGFALKITSLNLGGQSYPVATDTFATNTQGKGGYTTANTAGGAAIGALIGAIAGGGPGAAIGAVAGGGLGLGASAASNGPRSVMPPETLLAFHLQAPLTVSPVSMAEVQQLHAMAPIQQRVYARPRRVYAPYPYGYYPPPPPPPAYYYGYRYWR